MNSILGTVAAAAASAVVATLLGAVPASAAGPVEIKPAQVARGDDPHLPHLRGNQVVDGERRVDVPGRHAALLGPSGDEYVVTTLVGETWTTYRVGGDRPRVVLRGPLPEEVVLAGDGGAVAVTRSVTRRRTVIDVVLVATRDRVRRGSFAGYPRVLDLEGELAVIGGPGGAVRWNVRTGRRVVLDTGFVYLADLSSNRMASFDKDPYDGGCSTVSQIRSPRELLWVSCRESVRAFSPDGSRIVTQHKLTDGLGASRVWERTIEGRRLASYTVGSHFGTVVWEDDTSVLLDAYATRRWATVRCSEGTCERASAVRDTPRF